MAKFLGIKQVLKDEFDALERAEKINYMWFVRETTDGTSSGDTTTASIYFGSREYATLGGDVNIEEVISHIDGLVPNEDGTYSIDYKKVAENLDLSKIPGMSELSGKVETVYEAVFPSGEGEESLVSRVETLEKFKKDAEGNLLPMDIDINDDNEDL